MIVVPNLVHHEEASAYVAATLERLFAHLDDQTRLGAHMSRPSLMMGGGHMAYVLDIFPRAAHADERLAPAMFVRESDTSGVSEVGCRYFDG